MKWKLTTEEKRIEICKRSQEALLYVGEILFKPRTAEAAQPSFFDDPSDVVLKSASKNIEEEIAGFRTDFGIRQIFESVLEPAKDKHPRQSKASLLKEYFRVAKGNKFATLLIKMLKF